MVIADKVLPEWLTPSASRTMEVMGPRSRGRSEIWGTVEIHFSISAICPPPAQGDAAVGHFGPSVFFTFARTEGIGAQPQPASDCSSIDHIHFTGCLPGRVLEFAGGIHSRLDDQELLPPRRVDCGACWKSAE